MLGLENYWFGLDIFTLISQKIGMITPTWIIRWCICIAHKFLKYDINLFVTYF